jgi:hypothetical protein
VVVIDSDVLLLAFAFHRDARQPDNAAFLAHVQDANASTTVYNLMEVLAQLSFNLSPARLAEWESWLIEPYHLTVIWPQANREQDAEAFFRAEIFEKPFHKAREQGVAFLDALIIGLAERTPDVECLVTWNARHFKDKAQIPVLTPTEYLAQLKPG